MSAVRCDKVESKRWFPGETSGASFSVARGSYPGPGLSVGKVYSPRASLALTAPRGPRRARRKRLPVWRLSVPGAKRVVRAQELRGEPSAPVPGCAAQCVPGMVLAAPKAAGPL